jgi:hypothetical protein
MINLEELSLYFGSSYGAIIDRDYLENNILNYITRLNKFTFYIRSVIPRNAPVNSPSNADIQNGFKNLKINEVISCVDHFSKSDCSYYHIYSCPYTWTFFNNITNNFLGGLFKCVREISLHDERPFEYEFFLRIAQSFPFMEKLNLNNHQPQQKEDVQPVLISYHYLTKLDLIEAHVDYVKQFLNNTKTCLSTNIHLHVHYDCLALATDDFTKDKTKINCPKIIDLAENDDEIKHLSKLKNFFPYAKIY